MHRVVQDVFCRGVKTNQVITEVLNFNFMLCTIHVHFDIAYIYNYKNEDIE